MQNPKATSQATTFISSRQQQFLFYIAVSFLAFLGLLFATPHRGDAQEVSYSLVPTYEEIRWDDAFGFERTRLPGLRASIDFGPFFSLQPFYSWKDEVGLRDDLTPPIEGSDLYDLEAYGADLQVNFGRGSLVPFARGGGGVLRTEDETEGRRDRIFLRGGGGVRIGIGQSAGIELTAERWITRLSEPFVPGAVATEDFPEDGIVGSTVFGAGVRFALGGGYQETEGVSGILPGFFVEPYAARIDFADELRLARQYVTGARAGVDFNQNVGIRGYLWRGVDDDFSEWQEVEGYGAETQFTLNSGAGLSPFLVAGAGRINFKDDYRDLDDAPRSKENHLILGGGVAFGLGDHTRVELGARNYLMTVGSELEDVTSPDELVSNWKYSAGISLSFGASPETSSQRTAQQDADRERARYEEDLARLEEENRRLRSGETSTGSEERGDTVTSGRTITVPVPEVGEIILRYGDAYAQTDDGADPETLAALERRLDELLATQALGAPTDTTQARLQRELFEARLPEIVRQIVREEVGEVADSPPAPAPAPRPTFPGGSLLQDARVHTLIPYTGLQVSTPTQIIFGARADLGRITGPVPMTVLPEIWFGVGEGETTLKAVLNGRFGWNLDRGYNLTPYGQAGIGISNRQFLSLDLAYGLSFDAFRSAEAGPFHVFIEHRGLSSFEESQLLVGVSIGR